MPDPSPAVQKLSLDKAVEYLLEECRIVLPGIQVLFGFQLATVFTDRFAHALTAGEQRLHLLAVALVALAIALIMTPAAYHRQTEPQHASEAFIRISTRLLLASMPPLAVAICLDFYLVARMVLDDGIVAWLATGLFFVFVGLWFVLPMAARKDGSHKP
jgi:MFS-type transporter involved in bile tolerance (Atg22 family)